MTRRSRHFTAGVFRAARAVIGIDRASSARRVVVARTVFTLAICVASAATPSRSVAQGASRRAEGIAHGRAHNSDTVLVGTLAPSTAPDGVTHPDSVHLSRGRSGEITVRMSYDGATTTFRADSLARWTVASARWLERATPGCSANGSLNEVVPVATDRRGAFMVTVQIGYCGGQPLHFENDYGMSWSTGDGEVGAQLHFASRSQLLSALEALGRFAHPAGQ